MTFEEWYLREVGITVEHARQAGVYSIDLMRKCYDAGALEVVKPNVSGATQCIVRWMAETPDGWVGAWDKAALENLRLRK